MDRFVAFFWNVEDGAAAAQVNAWSEQLLRQQDAWLIALSCPGLVLLARPRSNGSLPITVSDDSDLAIVGSLYPRRRSEEASKSTLGPAEAAQILDSGGGALLGKYWGSFVALWRNKETGAVSVVRDPCGSNPCFRLRTPRISILCSYLVDAADLPGVRLCVNWKTVAAFLVHDYFITEHTGFNEVAEILPGWRWQLHADGQETKDWLWNPVEIAAQPCRLRDAAAIRPDRAGPGRRAGRPACSPECRRLRGSPGSGRA